MSGCFTDGNTSNVHQYQMNYQCERLFENQPALGFEEITRSCVEDIQNCNSKNAYLERELPIQETALQEKLKIIEEKEIQYDELKKEYVDIKFQFEKVVKEHAKTIEQKDLIIASLKSELREIRCENHLQSINHNEVTGSNKCGKNIKTELDLAEDAEPFAGFLPHDQHNLCSQIQEVKEDIDYSKLKESHEKLQTEVKFLLSELSKREQEIQALRNIEDQLCECYNQKEEMKERIKTLLNEKDKRLNKHEGECQNVSQDNMEARAIEKQNYTNEKVARQISSDRHVFNVNCKEFKYHTQCSVKYDTGCSNLNETDTEDERHL